MTKVMSVYNTGHNARQSLSRLLNLAIMNMKINSSHRLLREVQEQFSKVYPFLRIDFAGKAGVLSRSFLPAQTPPPINEDPSSREAAELLFNDFSVSGDMTVAELELLLQYHFGFPLQILRKSGNLWMETRNTRHWTIRQHNNHGVDLNF